jgi:hypothetical protein
MRKTIEESKFQRALEAVEGLPVNDQAMLIDLVSKRLSLMRRGEIANLVREARESFVTGDVSKGSVSEFMAALDD